MMADKARVNIYLSRDLKEKVYKLADEMGISISGLFCIAMTEYLKQMSVIDLSDMYKRFLLEELKKEAEGGPKA